MNEAELTLLSENKKLFEHNKLLSSQLAIAIEGLNALILAGTTLEIPEQTLQAMKNCEEDLSQDEKQNLE